MHYTFVKGDTSNLPSKVVKSSIFGCRGVSGPQFRNRNIWESRRQSKFYLGIWTVTAKNKNNKNNKKTRCDKVEETEVWKPYYDSNSNEQ
jgi:hypothetical protein